VNEKLMVALTVEIERRAIARGECVWDERTDYERHEAYGRIVSFLVEIGLGKEGGDGCAAVHD
jgi:hypothetical protein